MKSRRLLLAVLRESLPWLIALLTADAAFILFIWLVDTQAFFILIGLMLIVSLGAAAAPVAYRFMRYRRVWPRLEAFSREPDEAHEAALTDLLPAFQRHLVHTLGERLRAARTELNAADVAIAEYETWIESWVHGIKTPLALMRLLLDNRADEMSPLVAQRLGHVHTTITRDVEKILFYARLGAKHKDYLFERLNLHDVCMAAVEASRSSLEEAGVTLEIDPSLKEAPLVVSDRSGLTFILGQLLSNSIKHARGIRISADTAATEQFANGGTTGTGGRGKCPTNPSGTLAPSETTEKVPSCCVRRSRIAVSMRALPAQMDSATALRSAQNDGKGDFFSGFAPSPCPASPVFLPHETTASVVLTFSDNGPGVSAADLPFIFDKGFTGSSAAQETQVGSRHSGISGTNTGMGLYLAQRMANDLAIEITATSGQAPSGQAASPQTHGLTVALHFPSTRQQP